MATKPPTSISGWTNPRAPPVIWSVGWSSRASHTPLPTFATRWTARHRSTDPPSPWRSSACAGRPSASSAPSLISRSGSPRISRKTGFPGKPDFPEKMEKNLRNSWVLNRCFFDFRGNKQGQPGEKDGEHLVRCCGLNMFELGEWDMSSGCLKQRPGVVRRTQTWTN